MSSMSIIITVLCITIIGFAVRCWRGYQQGVEFNRYASSHGCFSPLGNMNDFYRKTGWSKEISHMTRVIDQPLFQDLSKKYGKSPV
ncbi:hypothetical protein LTR56_024493 [Elasticomyces elasticus]|nr:hypothetical protein LTR22_027536 [Elasticomyces elasticus]KAK3618668.1 hypothetical protein LTR56_024493 [Elasticomyces elasticus]KAK4907504.1 hypothetical protein LTR49_023487 [Elasticomyces elasticus]KAK5741702.1 hypothetical protein LTS12_024502 [Elasticomyces elasticus]